jgi:hypothetical protein
VGRWVFNEIIRKETYIHAFNYGPGHIHTHTHTNRHTHTLTRYLTRRPMAVSGACFFFNFFLSILARTMTRAVILMQDTMNVVKFCRHHSPGCVCVCVCVCVRMGRGEGGLSIDILYDMCVCVLEWKRGRKAFD